MIVLNSRQYFSVLFLLLILTDLVILLDIPVLRQILGLIFFTIFPGLIILHVLKVNEIEFLKKFCLSIGLSIAFLTLAGLLLNSFYPLIDKPLYSSSLLLFFNSILLILYFLTYLRVRNGLHIEIRIRLPKDFILVIFLLSLLLPLISVIGTYQMNSEGDNKILLLGLFLIILNLVSIIIVYKKNKSINKNSDLEILYPTSIFTAGLALILMYSLTSNYLMGRDVHWEFYFFRLTLEDFRWELEREMHAYHSCLSVTILPTVLYSLLGIDEFMIFKLFYPIINSIVPLVVYVYAKNYFRESIYPYIASFLFIFQFQFIYATGWCRQIVANFFLSLLVLSIFERRISKNNRMLLITIFWFLVVVSHYSVAYISFILITVAWVLLSVRKIFNIFNSEFNNEEDVKRYKFINLNIIIIMFLLLIGWYSQITSKPFTNLIDAIWITLLNLNYLFETELRNSAENALLGIGWRSPPNSFSILTHYLIFMIVIIGTLEMAKNLIKSNSKIDEKLGSAAAVIATIMLVLFVILPYVSLIYGGERIWQTLLILLSPAYIFGGKRIAKMIKKPEKEIYILTVLLILLFSCTTYLQYHIYGIPYSPIYENHGMKRDEEYIYDVDVFSAKWLKEKAISELPIFTDAFGHFRLILAYDNFPKFDNNLFTRENASWNGYAFLRCANIRVVYIKQGTDYIKVENSKFLHIFIEKNKIYDSGCVRIWG